MVDIINQPWDGPQERVGDILNRELATNGGFTSFTIVVAFAKRSGVAALQDHVQRFLADGHGVEAFVGIDARGTSQEALSMLLDLGVPSHVFHNPGHTFHPKLYLLEGPNSAYAIIGSSNLTEGGLYTNYELGAGLRLDLAVEEDNAIHRRLRGIIDALRNHIDTKDLTTELLEELSSHGLLGAETRSEEDAEAEAEGRRQRLAQGASLFERTPVPPAPRNLNRTRIVQPTNGLPGLAVGASQFVLLLGPRDARTQPGYSPDIYVPIAARNADPGFWGWQGNYVPVRTTRSRYHERRVNILVQTNNGAQLAEGKRIFHYEGRTEFRLNSSELAGIANTGDLLVLELPPEPITGVDYVGFVVSKASSLFPAYDAIAVNAVRNSSKRWGYA